MAILRKLLSFLVRFVQLLVSGLIFGYFVFLLRVDSNGKTAWTSLPHLWIFTTVVGGVGVIFSLLWILLFVWAYHFYIWDLIVAAAFFVAGGLMVHDYGISCIGTAGDAHIICGLFSACIICLFVDGALWLITGAFGGWIHHSERRDRVSGKHQLHFPQDTY